MGRDIVASAMKQIATIKLICQKATSLSDLLYMLQKKNETEYKSKFLFGFYKQQATSNCIPLTRKEVGARSLYAPVTQEQCAVFRVFRLQHQETVFMLTNQNC